MKDFEFTIVNNTPACDGVIKLELATEQKLPPVIGGQFIHLQVPGKSLRRPFCVYASDSHSVTLYIAVVGEGTEALAAAAPGEKLRGIMPLGNGFDLKGHKRIALIGGGLGVAALYQITKANADFYAYLGFQDAKRIIMADDFYKTCKKTTVCTDNGSFGYKGFPTDALKADLDEIRPDAVFVCGPHGLARAAAELCRAYGIDGYVSEESRMGCGVGACLVCTCAVTEDGVTKNKRVCKDGPVFPIASVYPEQTK